MVDLASIESSENDVNEQLFTSAIKKRRRKDRWFTAFVLLMSLFSLFPLFSVLYYVVVKGWQGFFFGNFFIPAAGTLEMTGFALIFAVPVGLALGVYLHERKGTRLAAMVYYLADLMAGMPSVLVGMTVYAVLVVTMGTFSLFAGSVALMLIMIPFLAKEIEAKLSPAAIMIKESAIALGATQMQALLRMVLPSMRRSIIVVILLSVSRAMGETAPLLFTSLGNQFWPTSVFSPASTLSLQIYYDALSPYSSLQAQAFAGALVLIVFILILFLLARWIARGDIR